MRRGPHRFWILAGGLILLFAAVAAASLWILPAPHAPFHYMLAGTLATAVELAAVFLVLLTTRPRAARRVARPY